MDCLSAVNLVTKSVYLKERMTDCLLAASLVEKLVDSKERTMDCSLVPKSVDLMARAQHSAVSIVSHGRKV